LLSPAGVITDAHLKAGIWISGGFYVPSNMLQLPAGTKEAWVNLFEFMGQPYFESPTVELDLRIINGKLLVGWQRNAEGDWANIWRRPFAFDKTNRWLMHLQPEQVDMWFNGEAVCSTKAKPVGVANAKGPQQAINQFYRDFNAWPGLQTIFQSFIAVGTKRELVERV